MFGLIREYGQLMVTKGPKLKEYQRWGYRLKKRQPKMKIIKYER